MVINLTGHRRSVVGLIKKWKQKRWPTALGLYLRLRIIPQSFYKWNEEKKKRNFDVDTYLKAAVNWWNNLLWWKAWNAAAPFNFHAAVLTQVKPSCLFQQPGRLTIFPYFFSSRLLWLERKEALFFVFSTIDSRQSRKPAVKQFFFILNIIFFFLLLLLFSIFLFLTFWCNAVVVVNHSLVTK